jgi:hypothetical protein
MTAYWLISRPQRDVLIAHLDGVAVPIVRNAAGVIGMTASEVACRFHTTGALIIRGLLRTDNKIKPTHTFITEEGRKIIARLLADWAEALTRAHYEAEDAAEMNKPNLRWAPQARSDRA